jgi:RHS repeat-associated protein
VPHHRRMPLLAATTALAVVAAGATALPAIAQPTVPPGGTAAVSTTATLGDKASFTMLRRDLSDRSQLAVNVASGNAVYSATDLDIAGVGQRLTIRRSFNSGDNSVPRTNAQLPGAWRISVGDDVSVSAGSASVTYHAPDGADYVFTKQSDGSFTAPAGINAKLTATDASTYTLRFNRGGVTETFKGLNGGPISRAADRDGNAITFNYGDQGQNGVTHLLSIVDTQGRTVRLTYGNEGRGPLTNIQDSTGRRIVYGYDTGGLLTSVQDGAGKTTRYGYAGSKLSLVTVPDGHQTAIAYQGATNQGQVRSVTYGADAGDASTTTFAYPDATSTKVTDANGNTTTYVYDNAGRVTKVTDALGHARSRSYTANDDPSAFTDATNAAVTLAYDNQSNLTKIQAPNMAGGAAGSGRSTLLGYPTPTGSLGDFQPTSATDAQGNKTSYGYNAGGHVSTVATPAAAGGTLTSKYQGDTGVSCGAKAGELCSTTDGNGHVTSYAYDTAGNLTKVTPPAPLGATTIAPDALGRPGAVTDGKGQVTSFRYDGDDRIIEIRYAGATACTTVDGTCVAYGYDGQGNLATRTDQSSTTYDYDAQGRLRSKQLLGPNGSPAHQFSMVYDFAGNLIEYSDPLGTVDYRYDAANRVGALAEPGGSCPGTLVFPNSTHCIGFSYDNNDRRTKTSFPSGQTNTYTYDPSGRMTKVTAANGATVLRSEAYTYALGGKDTALLQTLTPGSGNASSYAYDGLNRLRQQVTGSTTTRTWTYDKVGNRLTAAATGASTTSAAYNAADELCWTATTAGTSCTAPPAGATSYSYDGNGNVTASGTATYTYNARNQTSQARGSSSAYTDADSTERYNRSSANGESATFFNGPLGVTGQTGNVPNVGFINVGLTRDPDGAVIDVRTSNLGDTTYQSNFVTADHLGSTLLLTNQSAAVTANYSYDAWGVPTAATGATAGLNPARYAAGVTDPNGLVKFGTRYYDPAIGRWTQRDPIAGAIGDPGSVNRYPYVGDRPTGRTDPSGRSFLSTLATDFGVGAGAGGAAGTLGGCVAGGVSTGVAGGVLGPEGVVLGFAAGCLTGAATGGTTGATVGGILGAGYGVIDGLT